MTFDEAIEVMKTGKRVKHEYFTSEEFFEMNNGMIFAEDGCPMTGWYTGEEWQKTGWSLYDPQ